MFRSNKPLKPCRKGEFEFAGPVGAGLTITVGAQRKGGNPEIVVVCLLRNLTEGTGEDEKFCHRGTETQRMMNS